MRFGSENHVLYDLFFFEMEPAEEHALYINDERVKPSDYKKNKNFTKRASIIKGFLLAFFLKLKRT